ncbi:DUF3017 domain-containing protein [Aeromicrobium sp. YIM 150415]|uniref:DUF3017 domain-containing protein n=1 Tax=Aeromicrobium TaxID=2040 RepID=UPI00163DB4C7|nr:MULTISPECIES: DUF3017 domain-containing protein [Aeromicrobium]MBM9462239.1 DUF3017 domain-containing protein [Aeromicrobium sp. YIM 150415]
MRPPRSRGSRIYLIQLAAVLVGLVLVIAGAWRVGVATVGASFLIAAALRAVVTPDQYGMLRVRGKAFDMAWMLVLGGSLVFLAVNIPSQPPL